MESRLRRLRLPRGLPKRRGLLSVAASNPTEGEAQASQSTGTNAPKPDAVVTYMEHSNSCFDDCIVKPLRAAFAEIRAVRNHVVMSEDMQTNHGDIVEKVRKIDDEVWKILNSSKQVGRRFRNQVLKVKKKHAPVVRSCTKTKSVARQEAGKVKVASLASWRQECARARAALKQEGYKGSMKVKKGEAVHKKIVELRQARVAGGIALGIGVHAQGAAPANLSSSG